jgi:hypothetical protein
MKMNINRLISVGLLLFLLAACTQQETTVPTAAPEASAVSNKKLLEWGFDSPTPEYLRDNIRAMQGQPFDGIVFRLRKEAHSIFQTTPLTEEELKLSILSSVQWGQYNHNFLKLWSTDPSRNFSWFNNSQWNVITNNLKLYARAVKAARAKGIAFDVEPYTSFGNNPWAFITKEGQSVYPGKTLAQVEVEVRKRGAQFMNALQSEKQDITLLCAVLLGAYRTTLSYYPNNQQLGKEKSGYALLPAFVNGMLDVMGPNVRLVDGRIPYRQLDGTYYFDATSKFTSFVVPYVRGTNIYVSPENRSKYDAQVQVGHAVFPDYVFGLLVNTQLKDRMPTYYTSMTESYKAKWLEHNTYYALKTADQYVYLYNEQMSWWGAGANPKYPNLPAAIKTSVQSGRAKFLNSQPLGFSMVKPADKLWDANYQATFAK